MSTLQKANEAGSANPDTIVVKIGEERVGRLIQITVVEANRGFSLCQREAN